MLRMCLSVLLGCLMIFFVKSLSLFYWLILLFLLCFYADFNIYFLCANFMFFGRWKVELRRW